MKQKTVLIDKFWLILILILFLIGDGRAQRQNQALNWQEFVSDEGKFKIAFPNKPTKTVKEMTMADGKFQSNRFETATAEPAIYFGAWYTDYSNVPEMTQVELRTYYDNDLDAALKAINAVSLGDQDVWIGDRLGRESTWRVKNSVVRDRMFLIGNRKYQVLISTDAPIIENAGAQRMIDKFLDSFQLIEK